MVFSNAFTTASSYDVFLSYNSADHCVVEDIARKLRDEGLEPFLDRWALAPGIRWRSELEETLGSCKAIAIFVGQGQMGSWQQREVDVALDLQNRSPNLPVIPVLLPGCEPPLGFLGQLTWVDLRTRAIDQGIAILIRAARGEPPDIDLQRHFDSVRASICPYRGLLYFREEDAPFFFGREAAIEKLMDAVQRQRLVAVVGASGSGKSSVVRAGLVPRLRNERRTVWETVTMVPTDHPFKALARALVPLIEPTINEVDCLAEAAKLAEHFLSQTISVYDIVERILEKQSGTDRMLIVVDQFEEVYTLIADEVVRRRFLDELLATSSRTGSKANVALVLRGDFVGKALAYRPLSDRLQDAQVNLGPMARNELELAVQRPAERTHLEFEPGLISRILNDVGDEPGNLPLLEFVLKELWEKRRGCVLLNATYEDFGGLQGAVATKADQLFKDLSPVEQKILQRVFLRIVHPSESGENTRRRTPFDELPAGGVELVAKLTNQRLLVTNQLASGQEQTVEVAHEALISSWGTLRAWVAEDREFLLWRARLDVLLAEWERAGENDDACLRGPLLVEARKWFDQRSEDLSDQEKKFISASRDLLERLTRMERERQLREIEAARRLAEAQLKRAEEAEKHATEQKKSANKLRRHALIATGGAVAALILLAVSVLMWRAAVIARYRAEAATQQAKMAKQRAVAAKEAADELINYMQYDLSGELGKLGRLDIMEDINARIRRYHEEHPPEPDDEVAHGAADRARLVALDQQGDILRAKGDLEGALKCYRDGLGIARELAKQDPDNADWQRNLSLSYLNIGDLQSAQGNLAGALKSYRDSLAIAEKLARQDPGNDLWQRDLSVSYVEVGDVLSDQGDLAGALKCYRDGLTIAEKLSQQDPGNEVWQRDLFLNYARIGGVQHAQGDLAGALKNYGDSLAIAEKLAKQDPENAGRQSDLASGHISFGDVQRAQGDLSIALKSYSAMMAIAEKLAKHDPRNADWKRYLSAGHEKIGHVLRDQGDYVGALEKYRQSLAIVVKLAKQDPINARWQHDLSDCHNDIGRALEAQRDLSGALESYRESLAIREKLGMRDAGNAGWQGDLAYSYWKTGEVWSTIDPKSTEEARAMLEKGHNILRQLKKRRDLTADQQNWLNAIEADLQRMDGSSGEVEQSPLP